MIETPASSRNLTESITRVLLVVAALLAYVRLFIAVDVTDESFYNSLPYSFSLGLRPYRDELNITQNAGILLAPLYHLYHAVFQSSTGLVLFNRHLYVGFVALCSFLTFRVAAARVDRNFARLLAAFVLTFSYFNIPALSYNTLGALFLFLGLLQLLSQTESEPRKQARAIFGANVCFMLATFAHPSFLTASLAALIASWWLNPAGRRAWIASVALGALGALVFLFSFGADAINDSLAYARTYGYDLKTSGGRIVEVLRGQSRVGARAFAGVTGLLALPFLPVREQSSLRRILPWLVGGVTAIGLFLLHRLVAPTQFPTTATLLVLCIGALLPVALYFHPDRNQARIFAIAILLPCSVGGSTLAVFSSNGFIASMLALFPAAVTCLLCLGQIAEARGRATEALIGLVLLLAFSCVSLIERSYRDAPFDRGARAAFASGPFAGLITTEANARSIAALQTDLRSLEGTARTLFVYDNYPAGYLLSNLRPRTFSTWIFWPPHPVEANRLTRRVFGADEPPPDIVLQVQPGSPRLDAELQRLGYRVQIARREFGYVIFQRDHGAAPRSTQ
jgi:hypothetical protein